MLLPVTVIEGGTIMLDGSDIPPRVIVTVDCHPIRTKMEVPLIGAGALVAYPEDVAVFAKRRAFLSDLNIKSNGLYADGVLQAVAQSSVLVTLAMGNGQDMTLVVPDFSMRAGAMPTFDVTVVRTDG